MPFRGTRHCPVRQLYTGEEEGERDGLDSFVYDQLTRIHRQHWADQGKTRRVVLHRANSGRIQNQTLLDPLLPISDYCWKLLPEVGYALGGEDGSISSGGIERVEDMETEWSATANG